MRFDGEDRRMANGGRVDMKYRPRANCRMQAGASPGVPLKFGVAETTHSDPDRDNTGDDGE
jgi:hypothetical protein